MKRGNTILLLSTLLLLCTCSKKGSNPPPQAGDQYWLYVVDGAQQKILKIDTETDSLVDSVGYAGGIMWGMTITPDDRQLWLSGDSQIVVYDAAALAIVGNASVPEAEVHFPPGKSYAVATDGRAVYFVDRNSLGVLDVDSTASGMIATFLWPDSSLLLGVNLDQQP